MGKRKNGKSERKKQEREGACDGGDEEGVNDGKGA